MNIYKKKILNTLYSYFKARKLLLLLGMVPFSLGKDRIGYEILRERLNLGIQRTLKRRYFKKNIYENYNSIKLKNINSDNIIWFMWLQGIDNAPDLCKANFHYLNKKFPDTVELITKDNVFKYIDIPEFIKLKWKNGYISNTHFSDIVRVQLLCTYGGTWIDSTVVVKSDFILNLPDFQIPQTYGPGRNGHSVSVSNWFMHSQGTSKFLNRVRDLLFEYWKNNDRALDYFIFHHFLMIASLEMDNYLDKIPPLDNTMPHFLMLKMRKEKINDFQMNKYLHEFTLLKFTNKMENDMERDNYKRLTLLIKTSI